eukprot:scaffold54617_cov17-Prasinocladus_malaysianus.AAC.1
MKHLKGKEFYSLKAGPVSFHKYGDFFPGTGAVGDIGYGTGKGYSLNVPLQTVSCACDIDGLMLLFLTLQEGMDDESYRT